MSETYGETASGILDIAQELTQTRGWNGFSYADIAERIGIRKASVHHHFRTKGELGAAMVVRFRGQFASALAELSGTRRVRLLGFADLFGKALASGRMCLCGTLAVEFETLPEGMQGEVRRFFVENLSWLESVFGERRRGDSKLPPASALAKSYLSMVEGAMLSARALGDADSLEPSVQAFLAGAGVR